MHSLDENSPTIEQPKDLSIPLKWHQLTMIRAMLDAEASGEIIRRHAVNHQEGVRCVSQRVNAGILADKVGAGKTFTIIGLICAKRIPDQIPFYYTCDNMTVLDPKEPVRANLIVVPHNIFNQWSKALASSNLKTLCLANKRSLDCFFDITYDWSKKKHTIYDSDECKSVKDINEAKAYFKKNNIQCPDKEIRYWRKLYFNNDAADAIIRDYDVILVSAIIYKKFSWINMFVKWARVIYDEASNFKKSHHAYGSFYWLITATPHYKIASVLAYSNVDSQFITYKNKDSFVDQQMTVQEPQAFIIRTGLDAASKIIADLVSKDILTMINAGNIKGAAIQLNCGVDTKENIIQAFASSLDRRKEAIAKEVKLLIKHQKMGADHKAKIANLNAEAASIDEKINSLKERLFSIDSELCFICACEFDNPAITECCSRIFCFVCLATAISGTQKCPYCMQAPKFKLISADTEEKDPEKESKKVPEKFIDLKKTEAFVELMNAMHAKNPKARLLVFSEEMDHCYDICKANQLKYTYARFKGTRAYLDNTLKKYDAGKVNILLVDPKHYGSGVNIHMTDYVVLLHRLDPSLEIQGIGRAQRYGRTSALKIIYMVNERERCTTPYQTTEIKTLSDVSRI